MVTLAEIRDDIVDESKSLTSILRKAKILAYRLGNNDFKNWIEWELTGYPDETFLPDYRLFETDVRVNGYQGWNRFENMRVQLPESLKDTVTQVTWRHGIPQIESIHEKNKTQPYLAQPWPTDLVILLNKMFPQYTFSAVNNFVAYPAVTNILVTVRDKLLSFVLELERLYPDTEMVDEPNTSTRQQEVAQLVHTHITVNHSGGNFQMSQFDQREQQVSGNQYNAGHDINFGDIRTKDELVDALSYLREQVGQIPAESEEDEDAISDVKYHLEKASIEAKKAEPNKATIKSRIQNAMTVATSASVLTGLVINLDKVVAILDKLF